MTDFNGHATADSWRRALLPQDATIQQAITSLNASGFQMAIAVGTDGRLVGTITDGDIRRGILRGLSLSSPAASIVRQDPLVVPAEMDRATVLQLMHANAYSAIPIVDGVKKVVGLHLLKELIAPPQRENVMVIMAGGEGRRLRPFTENCPKPMVPVGGKPMLEHIIERARADGFFRFVLAVHYLGHMIEDYFQDGSRWQVEIEYLREETPLGTAGAISLFSRAPAEPVVVSNGDVLTDIRYAELLDFHNRHDAIATMAVRLHEWEHPFGVVRTRGVDIVGFDEKPVSRSHINAGIYVLEPSAIAALETGKYCDMPTLFSRLQESGHRTIVYPMHEPWLDVGRPDDVEKAHQTSRGIEVDEPK